MRTFNDNAGRAWTVQINIQAITRIRDLARVHPLDEAAPNLPLNPPPAASPC